jgi:hypothetical protein
VFIVPLDVPLHPVSIASSISAWERFTLRKDSTSIALAWMAAIQASKRSSFEKQRGFNISDAHVLDVVELENGTTKIYCLYMVHYGSI